MSRLDRNANYRTVQQWHIFLPNSTLFQRFDFIVFQPLVKPFRPFLSKLFELEIKMKEATASL
jgi:hypothetical protein